MINEKKIDFCTTCRKETKYTLKKQNEKRKVKNKEYTFIFTVAICDKCGADMNLLELIDKNIQEFDKQYRAYENIISMTDIEKLMKIYNLGKATLSNALGFGEITITRYLDGQIPSKEYSDIMKNALSSPKYMREKLNENKDRLTPTAYNKAMDATDQLENLSSMVSPKMLSVISYLFKSIEEVTPLMLQKLLYFIQGESFILSGKPIFPETCQAWVHGPVYPQVYDMFKDFKYNPIDDERFVIFEYANNQLSDAEYKAIDLVVDTFGEYGGKLLERITHKEDPWRLARNGYADEAVSNETILTDAIEAYFVGKHTKYDFSTKNGLKKYISDMLN